MHGATLISVPPLFFPMKKSAQLWCSLIFCLLPTITSGEFYFTFPKLHLLDSSVGHMYKVRAFGHEVPTEIIGFGSLDSGTAPAYNTHRLIRKVSCAGFAS